MRQEGGIAALDPLNVVIPIVIIILLPCFFDTIAS